MPSRRSTKTSLQLLTTVLAEVVSDPTGENGLPSVVRSGEVPPELIELAVLNRVDACLVVALRCNGLEVPDVLELADQRAAMVHLQTSRALASIETCFDALGIDWAVVKGPAVARVWPGGSVSRTYDDLDLLVGPCSFRQATAALEGIGFSHRNHNWDGFVDLGVAEIPLDDGSVVVDLHWNLVALEQQRHVLRLDTSNLLAGTTREHVAGSSVPVLSDLDAFVHLCCHAGLAGGRTLRMLRDIHLFAQRVDPEDARRALVEAGCDRLAAPLLARAIQHFGPVRSPDGSLCDAVRLCGHHYWIATNRLVDRAWSATSRTGHLVPPGALVAAGRAGLVATSRALLSGVSEAIRTRLGMTVLTSEGGRLHWDTGSRLDERAGRDRYWSYVSDAGRCVPEIETCGSGGTEVLPGGPQAGSIVGEPR